MEASGFIPQDWRAWRRLRVLQLKQQGWRQRDIAEALGASEVSVSRWLRRAREGGPDALLSRPAPGHPPKLSPAQRRLIPEFLWHGPEAYGFHGQVWTCARVAKVIEEEFGVSYHKDHVGRLLRELHWTPQVPIRRAIQRDEEAIRRWRDEVWPDLQRRAGGGGAGGAVRAAAGGPARAPGAGLRGRIGVLPAAGGGPDVRPRGADAGPPRDADSRPPVGHGRDDASRPALHPGTATVAQRAAHHRGPLALGARGGHAAVGDLGRVADSL